MKVWVGIIGFVVTISTRECGVIGKHLPRQSIGCAGAVLTLLSA